MILEKEHILQVYRFNYTFASSLNSSALHLSAMSGKTLTWKSPPVCSDGDSCMLVTEVAWQGRSASLQTHHHQTRWIFPGSSPSSLHEAISSNFQPSPQYAQTCALSNYRIPYDTKEVLEATGDTPSPSTSKYADSPPLLSPRHRTSYLGSALHA